MSLTEGTKLGSYQIIAPIGAGGMGEVYRARDAKLKRDVAIKVLPDDVAEDEERLQRFEMEAQVLASLNHPHIAAIYGLQGNALVLELIEGPTLSERIIDGPLGWEEAVHIARQIAEALEYAHDHGILHRDLKPSNVKLTADGDVKVLDFGLAKALDEGKQLSGEGSLSPTLTRSTKVGRLLGTADYMPPEQVKGKPLDKRADVWAFGVVLFELLTGRNIYSGETIPDTLASVISKEPPWETLPADTPSGVRQLLRRCLTKDPKQRLRDIGEARIALSEPLEQGVVAPAERTASPSGRPVLPWVLVGLLAVAVAVLVSVPPAPRASMHLSAEIGADASLYMDFGPAIDLSPDGSTLAFVASPADDGDRRLFVRHLDRVDATPFPGTEGARHPFFSPDGQWIGFFAQGKLRKIAATGGGAVTLADAPNDRGGTWSEDGTIIFTPGHRATLYRVSAEGGIPEPLTTFDVDESEVTHRWPHALPGGDTVLFTASDSGVNFNEARIALVSLRDGERRLVHRGGSLPRYLTSGYLLYVHEGTLFAMSFDPSRPDRTGTPFTVMTNVVSSSLQGVQQIALSNADTLAYVAGGDVDMGRGHLDWLHRDGTTETLLREPAYYLDLEFSPDGRRLALSLREQHIDVWIYELERDTISRLTFEEWETGWPVWSPDGRRIVFATDSRNPGTHDLFWTRADATGEVERLTDSPNNQMAFSWHPNGKLIAFEQESRESARFDVLVLPLEGDESSGWTPGEPMPMLAAAYDERRPAFSPDGNWLAYASDESGKFEIYVRPFPDVSKGKWPISRDGGTYPTWSRHQNELFFFHPEGRIMVAEYAIEGESFRAERPEVWSEAARLNFARNSRDYALHPDGDRVAVFVPEDDVTTNRDHVTFVFDFSDELDRLARSPRPR